MIEFILSFISVSKILELPAIVQIPGLLVLFLLVYRMVNSLKSFSPIKAMTSFTMLFVVAVFLSSFGNEVATMLESHTAQ